MSNLEWKMQSVECVKCKVWSVKCKVRSVKCKVRSVKYQVWSVQCRVWSVLCKVWSVKCKVMTSEVSGMKVSEHIFMILIRFRYDLLLRFFLWFGFALMILIWFQLQVWYTLTYNSWCGSKLCFEANPLEAHPKTYQSRIKIVSKPYLGVCFKFMFIYCYKLRCEIYKRLCHMCQFL